MQSVKPYNLLNNNMSLIISNEGLAAIKHIVKIAPQEAQWFHTIDNVEKTASGTNLYLSTDIFIPKQDTSAAEVNTSSSMMIEFYNELKDRYSDQQLINSKLSSMNCWCHSHHNMAPNPSGQDLNQFKSFIEASLSQNQANYHIMLIFNKRDEFYSRVYDPNTGYIYEGVNIRTYHNYDFSYIDQAAKTKFLKPKPKFKPLPKSYNYDLFSSLPTSSSTRQTVNFSDLKVLNDAISEDLLNDIFTPQAISQGDFPLNRIADQNYALEGLYNTLDTRELTYFSMLISNNSSKIKNVFSDKALESYWNRYQETIDNRITKYFKSNSTFEDLLKMVSLTCAITDLDTSLDLPKLLSYYGVR